MRVARGLLLIISLVACGDGASVVTPSRYDIVWGDIHDVQNVRDPGLDDRPDPGTSGGDPGGPDVPDPEVTLDDGLPDAPSMEVGADATVPPDAATDPAATDPGPGDADVPTPDDPGVGDPGHEEDGMSDPGPGDPGSGSRDLSIRFVAANLTSGSNQSYDPGHGIRLMAGCRGDVLLVQEFNYGNNGSADYREMVDAICGTDCHYSVGPGRIPNGVVSRWPIVASGWWDDPNLSDRELDWARIDLPGDRDLFVVSVHLHTSPSSDQVEAAQVVARRVSEHRAGNPDCCWYVVGGDFNGTASVSNSGFGQVDGEPIFWVSGPDPVGEDGLEGTNASRENQYDFVLLDTALRVRQVPSVFPAEDGGLALTYPDGLVFDSRNFTQVRLDRHFSPARTGDSAAPQMQHMAVVKDVTLPTR